MAGETNPMAVREVVAEKYGAVFEQLWDTLNVATDKWEVLVRFSASELVAPQWSEPHELAHGIRVLNQTGAGPVWSRAAIASTCRPSTA